MSDTNHECKSRTRKIVTNILSTSFVTDTKYKKCWKLCVADWNVNAPLVYSRGKYNTLKWKSESIVYGNSIHNRKKISTLKISAEVCSLIFLLWEIAYKKNASLSSMKQAAHIARLARFVTSREIGLFLSVPLAGIFLHFQQFWSVEIVGTFTYVEFPIKRPH